jgi:DNA-directed RNA polymerase specialized sigma24 family protein
MAKGRRTDLPTAALVMEMKETEGRSENEISQLTGVPAGTVHNILSRATAGMRLQRATCSSDIAKNSTRRWSKPIEP